MVLEGYRVVVARSPGRTPLPAGVAELRPGPRRWQAGQSKESTDFVTFGLFTIVERLREILGKDRKSIVMLDGIVRNQVMYEWFTVRAGRLSGISVFL